MGLTNYGIVTLNYRSISSSYYRICTIEKFRPVIGIVAPWSRTEDSTAGNWPRNIVAAPLDCTSSLIESIRRNSLAQQGVDAASLIRFKNRLEKRWNRRLYSSKTISLQVLSAARVLDDWLFERQRETRSVCDVQPRPVNTPHGYALDVTLIPLCSAERNKHKRTNELQINIVSCKRLTTHLVRSSSNCCCCCSCTRRSFAAWSQCATSSTHNIGRRSRSAGTQIHQRTLVKYSPFHRCRFLAAQRLPVWLPLTRIILTSDTPSTWHLIYRYRPARRL